MKDLFQSSIRVNKDYNVFVEETSDPESNYIHIEILNNNGDIIESYCMEQNGLKDNKLED